MASVDDTSLAAILAPSVAASSRISSSAAHSASPRIRGTANRPSTAFGASASASSWVRHGSTVSGRNTLTSLSGLPVGSTPVTSTAWIWLTWLEDGVQLAGEAVQLVLGQREAGQARQVGYLVSGDL